MKEKGTLLWSVLTMIKTDDTEEGEREFFDAFGVFEHKMERGLFFILAALGSILSISAFLEFRGMLDFVFRVLLGLCLLAFSLWQLKH